jgi:CO/xanthine dehydrogenase Mo-binding subunit
MIRIQRQKDKYEPRIMPMTMFDFDDEGRKIKDPETNKPKTHLCTVDETPRAAYLDNPEEAMKTDAPVIHESLDSYVGVWNMIKKGNVCTHVKLNRGDVEKGFKEADLVFEDRFTTQIVHNVYIEPHAAVATIDHSGKITVWTSTQRPHFNQLYEQLPKNEVFLWFFSKSFF